jgi:hypothetical protein
MTLFNDTGRFVLGDGLPEEYWEVADKVAYSIDGSSTSLCPLSLIMFLKHQQDRLNRLENSTRVGKEGSSNLHPLVKIILYGDVEEVSWDCIKERCVLDERGEIDVGWANSMDTEQSLRLSIAATVQSWFDSRGTLPPEVANP